MNEEFRGDSLHDTETENQNKNREVQRDTSHELLDWLQEFRENVVDESTSEGERPDAEESLHFQFVSSSSRSRKCMWNRVLVSTVYLRTF